MRFFPKFAIFSLLDFSSGSFSLGPSSKSKLDRKYDLKESPLLHQYSKYFKYFPKLNHLVEASFITFLTSLLLRFMSSLSCFFRFALQNPLQCQIALQCQQQNPQQLQKAIWLLFPAHNCAKCQG